MDSSINSPAWARSSSVSTVTVGLFSWLEDVARVWRARHLKEYRWIPTSALFVLYFSAALMAAVSYTCDMIVLAAKDAGRAVLEDRRAARQLRRVIAATSMRQPSSTTDS